MARLDMTHGARVATAGLLVLVLLVGAGNLWATYDQAAAVRHNSATLVQLCETGNEFRAEQAGLWMFLIHISKPPKTAQQRAVLAKFENHLHAVFQPRNCHAITHSG